jgi:hypothetical protein
MADHGFPLVRAAAYDTQKGRLWAICDRCHRWNLWPVEERAPVIEGLERVVKDRGIPVAQTENVTLLRADSLGLVRVGDAGLEERSWWRYGRELHRRRVWRRSPASRVSAYAYGAFAVASEALGLHRMDQKIRWDEGGLTDILRWRRFGWAAWRGRLECPNCGSVRRALLYNTSWWLYPISTDRGLAVAVPCPRCDFWTPEIGYTLEGDAAELTLRRVLAYQHIDGASEKVVREAVGLLARAGSLRRFLDRVGTGATSLWSMEPGNAVALEIAVNECAERRFLNRLAREYDWIWQREEELAAIIDDELG